MMGGGNNRYICYVRTKLTYFSMIQMRKITKYVQKEKINISKLLFFINQLQMKANNSIVQI